MPNPPPRPNPQSQVMRALPYFYLVDVVLRIGSDAIDFYHHVTHPQTKQTTKVAGSHKFTAQEIATLNAGGTVVITDLSGNSYLVKL